MGDNLKVVWAEFSSVSQVVLSTTCPHEEMNIQPWSMYYKTFYGRNLQIFVISQSVCPWQALPFQSNNCGGGQEPTLEWST